MAFSEYNKSLIAADSNQWTAETSIQSTEVNPDPSVSVKTLIDSVVFVQTPCENSELNTPPLCIDNTASSQNDQISAVNIARPINPVPHEPPSSTKFFSQEERARFWTEVADPFVVTSFPRGFIYTPIDRTVYELTGQYLDLPGLRKAVYRFRLIDGKIVKILIQAPVDNAGKLDDAIRAAHRSREPLGADGEVVRHSFTKRYWRDLLGQGTPEGIWWNIRMRRPYSEFVRRQRLLSHVMRDEIAVFCDLSKAGPPQLLHDEDRR